MKRKPLSAADRVAASNLRRIWDEKKLGLKLTQDKAAEYLGFSTQGAVSHYLNGRTPLNTDAVLKFAELLQVSPTEIRPDLKELLGGNTSLHDALSPIVRDCLAWLSDQAIQGKLSDANFLILRGRAEQMVESNSS